MKYVACKFMQIQFAVCKIFMVLRALWCECWATGFYEKKKSQQTLSNIKNYDVIIILINHNFNNHHYDVIMM